MSVFKYLSQLPSDTTKALEDSAYINDAESSLILFHPPCSYIMGKPSSLSFFIHTTREDVPIEEYVIIALKSIGAENLTINMESETAGSYYCSGKLFGKFSLNFDSSSNCFTSISGRLFSNSGRFLPLNKVAPGITMGFFVGAFKYCFESFCGKAVV